MSVTATNLLGGAGELYHGAFGAVEPLDTAVTAALDDEVWTDFGGTSGGVTMVTDRDFFDLRVDQVQEAVGTRLRNRTININTNLAEITLENLARAWGQDPTDITTGGTGGTAWKGINLTSAEPAEEPDYHALIFRGFGPARKRRLIIARKVLSVSSVGVAFQQGEQTVIPVSFRCFWVSSSIAPIRVVESTAV